MQNLLVFLLLIPFNLLSQIRVQQLDEFIIINYVSEYGENLVDTIMFHATNAQRIKNNKIRIIEKSYHSPENCSHVDLIKGIHICNTCHVDNDNIIIESLVKKDQYPYINLKQLHSEIDLFSIKITYENNIVIYWDWDFDKLQLIKRKKT